MSTIKVSTVTSTIKVSMVKDGRIQSPARRGNPRLRWLHCIGEGDVEIISRPLAIEAEQPVEAARRSRGRNDKLH